MPVYIVIFKTDVLYKSNKSQFKSKKGTNYLDIVNIEFQCEISENTDNISKIKKLSVSN